MRHPSLSFGVIKTLQPDADCLSFQSIFSLNKHNPGVGECRREIRGRDERKRSLTELHASSDPTGFCSFLSLPQPYLNKYSLSLTGGERIPKVRKIAAQSLRDHSLCNRPSCENSSLPPDNNKKFLDPNLMCIWIRTILLCTLPVMIGWHHLCLPGEAMSQPQ